MARGRYSVTRAALSRWVNNDMEGVRFLERLIDDVQALSIAAPYLFPKAPSSGSMFVVPAGGTLRGGRVTVRNLAAVATTFSLYVVPFGGVKDPSNAVVLGQAIDAGAYFDVTLPDSVSGVSVTVEAAIADSVTGLQTGGDLQ
jgi:hypothetical protein